MTKGLKVHNAVNRLTFVPNLLNNGNSLGKKIKFIDSKIKKIIRSCPGFYSCTHYFRNRSFTKKTQQFLSDSFLYHEPCYILRPYSGPKICNIYDLSHIYYAECHPRERVKFLLRCLPKSINDADHIITGSHFIRDEIIDCFKISSNKITTIYNGVAPIFKDRQRINISPFLTRYGLLNKSYLLSVCTLEPRKNLERLLQAFKLLPEQQRKKFPLVLVGIKGWGTHRLMKLINQLIRREELYCLGYVSRNDLPYLYSGAHGFVYVSLYEGFGLPLLEALASGVPTLTSNSSSLPEVVGDAAILIDPLNTESIVDGLNRLINDNFLRDKLKYKGLVQASKFSWQKCVNETVDVYKHVLASFS